MNIPKGSTKEELKTREGIISQAYLRKAVKFGKPTPTKKGVKNQEKFAKMQQMRCDLDGIGVVKMIVGFKQSGEIIQYCITTNRT